MTNKEITASLEQIATKEGFARISAELVEAWSESKVGIEAIDPILRFMENHPFVDYGMPGSLVHFAEGFYGNGYEEKLVESVKRKPTAHTVGMLNRVINGTKISDVRHKFIAVMKQAKLNPLADKITLQQINRFLERLTT